MKDLLSTVIELTTNDPVTPLREDGIPLLRGYQLVTATMECNPMNLKDDEIVLNSYNGKLFINTAVDGTQKLTLTAKMH